MAFASVLAARVPKLLAKTKPLPAGCYVQARTGKAGDGSQSRISEQPDLSYILGMTSNRAQKIHADRRLEFRVSDSIHPFTNGIVI